MNSSIQISIVFLMKIFISISGKQLKSLNKIDFGDGRFLSGIPINLSSNSPPVRGYFGIRYASLGKIKNTVYTENRFNPPVASFFYEEFTGDFIQDKFAPVCPQNLPNMTDFDKNKDNYNSYWHHIKRILPFLEHQDEECLTLNIYVPENNHTSPFPVLLFIHGESFEIGSGNAYDVSKFASYGQIIGITLNYRLGLLGFLKSDDNLAQGNYAFYDIFAALQWISTNIYKFNGDSNKVTLMGHGHGAALVHLFSLSKMLKDMKKKLFHRLIIINGNGLSGWSWSQFSHMYMNALGKYMNVSSKLLFRQLKREPITNILKASEFTPKLKFSSRIGPTISNQLFTYASKLSRNLVPSNKEFYRELDVLVGLNGDNAGFFFNAPLLLKNNDFSELKFQSKLKEFIKENYVYNQQSIYEILYHLYTDWQKMDPLFEHEREESRISMFNKMINDAFFIIPALQFCNIHSSTKSQSDNQGKTYLYMFSKQISYKRDNSVYDAQFSDDLMMLFGTPNHRKYSHMELSRTMMKYLSNFVKFGNPNEPKPNYPYELYNQFSMDYWPQYTVTEKQYVNFDLKTSSKMSVRSNLASNEYRIWDELIPKLHQSFQYPIDWHKREAFGINSNRKTFDNDFDYNMKFIVPDDPIVTSTLKMSTSTSPLRTLKLDLSITKNEEKKIEESVSSTIKEDFIIESIKINTLLWTILAGVAFFLINSIAIMCIYMNIRKLKLLRQNIRGPINNSLSPLRLEFDNEQPVDLNYSGSDLKTPLDFKHETTFLISNQSPDMYATSREISAVRPNCKTLNSCSSIKYPYENTDVKTAYFRICDNDPVTIV